MVTVTSPQTAEQTLSITGKSTDTKPTVSYNGLTIKNGSTFYEMNTGDIYMYDEEAKTWLLQ